jgi:DNA-binding transcriptional ArsR family regulator
MAAGGAIMSVAGILDAMRSPRPLSERVVWQCLENHANGHRFWPITIDELAYELHMNRSTVLAAIKALEDDEIIRAERRRRCKTIYHMLRVYPQKPGNGVDKPDPNDEIGSENPTAKTPPPGMFESQFSIETAPKNAILRSENPTPILNPTVRKKERPTSKGGHTRALAHAPPSNVVRLVTSSMFEEVVSAWNVMATGCGLTKVRIMPEDHRRNLVNTRVKQVGDVSKLFEAIEAIGASSFCRGDNDRGWVADFDFLLQRSSLSKILLGRYKDRPGRQRARPGTHAAFEQKLGLRPMQPTFDPEPDDSLRRIGP